MAEFFTFTDDELKEARKIFVNNGEPDTAKQDKLMKEAQETGKISIFGFGSLMHTAHTDQEIKTTKGHVDDMSIKIRHAWNYYGGEAGKSGLMISLDEDKGAIAHGLIQEVEIKSAADFLKYYDNLQVRENPVNNPIYNTTETIEVTTENGETVTCISCLCDKESPLYIGDELTIDEQAVIVVHGMGSDQRLDNAVFREAADFTADSVQFLDLQAHQKTNSAYFYNLAVARKALGFPSDDYLDGLIDRINANRRDMYSPGRDMLESAENTGDRPEGLAPRDQGLSDEFAAQTQEDVFKKYVAANDKLQDILMDNEAYRNWDREWCAPDPFAKYEQA